MAEAEEVITDAARHATIFVRDLWQRHRVDNTPANIRISDVANRLELFVNSVTGLSLTLRKAQLPAHPTFLALVFKKVQKPVLRQCIPATDGQMIWLPPEVGTSDFATALERYRVMAMQQCLRAQRGSHRLISAAPSPLAADVYLLLEAWSVDQKMMELLPGLRPSAHRFREHVVATRPPLSAFAESRLPIEKLLRNLLTQTSGFSDRDFPVTQSPEESMLRVPDIIAAYSLEAAVTKRQAFAVHPLLKDWWTGELRPGGTKRPDASATADTDSPADEDSETRSGRLVRRPEIREAQEDEDEEQSQGVWMVQGDEPHQHAEDPLGLQRPTDKDEETSAEEYADLVSELPEARLVNTPGRAKEVLISDDPPNFDTPAQTSTAPSEGESLQYPEWDYRTQSYVDPGATIRIRPCGPGSRQWVDSIMTRHAPIISSLKRQFELLRARRVVLRRQLDGEEIDLDAYVDSYSSYRAGGNFSDRLYLSSRNLDRDMAVTVLVDISGSTDSWIAQGRRVIDVEREALLLVCLALQSTGEPWSVLGFSGEGRQSVTIHPIKNFDENFSTDIALRISSLEPEKYTRAGAALRHATAELMRASASHRLLIFLSDGKPNDNDHYEGRYGVEDMRQAVVEAKLQGVSPFCITIDHQAAGYLPRIFGSNQYGLLPRPEHLPQVMLDWLKRLMLH